jgi:hypothetical protein
LFLSLVVLPMDSSSQPNSSAPTASANPGGSAGPQTGEKRRASARDSPLPDPASAPKKSRKSGKKKAKTNQHHLKKDDIPLEQKGTKVSTIDIIFLCPLFDQRHVKAAGYLHGYILLELTRADAAPPMPTPAVLATFDQRWEPGFLPDLRRRLRDTSTAVVGTSRMVSDLRKRAEKDAAKGSNIAKDILEVKDTFLTIIFSRVLVAGLTHWCPDLMGPSDSPYNQVHETVYLETFRLVAGSFSYYFLAPSAAGVDNPILICDIFRSFTFSYTKHKAKVELRQPGKLASNKADNNSGKRRKRVRPTLFPCPRFLIWTAK